MQDVAKPERDLMHQWLQVVSRYGDYTRALVRREEPDPERAAALLRLVWIDLIDVLANGHDDLDLPSWLEAATRRRQTDVASGQRLNPALTTALAHEIPLGLGDDIDIHAVLVGAALSRLSSRCRTMILQTMAGPPRSYADISAALQIPIGSIGPQRARCLARFRTEVGRLAESLVLPPNVSLPQPPPAPVPIPDVSLPPPGRWDAFKLAWRRTPAGEPDQQWRRLESDLDELLTAAGPPPRPPDV